MDVKTYVIKLSIPIHDSLLSLGYSAVLTKLSEAFPFIETVEEWVETGEYRRLEESVISQGIDSERGEAMLHQLRVKQISHGPTFRLKMSASDG